MSFISFRKLCNRREYSFNNTVTAQHLIQTFFLFLPVCESLGFKGYNLFLFCKEGNTKRNFIYFFFKLWYCSSVWTKILGKPLVPEPSVPFFSVSMFCNTARLVDSHRGTWLCNLMWRLMLWKKIKNKFQLIRICVWLETSCFIENKSEHEHTKPLSFFVFFFFLAWLCSE